MESVFGRFQREGERPGGAHFPGIIESSSELRAIPVRQKVQQSTGREQVWGR